MTVWNAISAPKDTPAEIITKLQRPWIAVWKRRS